MTSIVTALPIRRPPCRRIVLVASGTSQQGRAFIDQIGVSHPRIRIYALTRSPDSETARRLLATGKVERLVRADLNDPQSVRQVFEDAKTSSPSSDNGGIKVVFAVLPFVGLGKDTEVERRQGKVRAHAVTLPKARASSPASVSSLHFLLPTQCVPERRIIPLMLLITPRAVTRRPFVGIRRRAFPVFFGRARRGRR
jgi:NmrA-like family